MGQLYYPRQKSPLLDVAKMGLQLYGIKKNFELGKGKLDVMRQREAREAGTAKALYGEDVRGPTGGTIRKPGLKEREVSDAERLTSLKQKEVDIKGREQGVSNMDFSPDLVMRFRAGLQKGPGGDYTLKSFERSLNMMESWAKDPDVTKGVAFDNAIAQKDRIYGMIIEDAGKQHEELVKKEMGESPEAKDLLGLVKDLSGDKDGAIIKQMFPGVVQERETAAAELAVKIKDPKLYKTEQGLLPADKAVGLKPPTKTPAPEQPGVAKRREIATAKDIAGAEQKINNPDNLKAEMGDMLQSEVDFFNQYSPKGYVYVYTSGEVVDWGRDKPARVDKIKLPKGTKAEDIYFTAQKYGVSIEEVLQALGVLKEVAPNAS